jgi:hypothetical protein
LDQGRFILSVNRAESEQGVELHLRYVQKHGLITFPAGAWFQETGATALDLHLATSLLLNVLHICTSLSDNLSSEIESRDRFQVNRNPFLRPFTLYAISAFSEVNVWTSAYTAVFITLNRIRLAPTESSLVNEIR